MFSTQSKGTSPVFASRISSAGNKNKAYIILLYLISPLLALFVAIKGYRYLWAKNVVWVFTGFYGYTFVVSKPTMDASRLRDHFISLANLDLSFSDMLGLLYSDESAYVDVAQPLLLFFVSSITSNPKIYFLVIGLVFGYFYSRNIWYLIGLDDRGFTRAAVLLLVTFALNIGFWEINGFRMWTAAHVFFYGAIRYVNERSFNGLLVAALTPFVHFSFFLPVFVLLIYGFSKNRVHIYFGLLICSLFVAELDLQFVQGLLKSILPSAFTGKVEGYTDERELGEIAVGSRNLSWHAVYYMKALKWAIIILLSLIYFKDINFIKQHKNVYSTYCFALCFLGIANIVSHIPSVGRFVKVANLFALAAIYLYFQFRNDSSLRRWLVIVSPLILLFCIVSIRESFNTVGIATVAGNPFTAIFVEGDLALIELIK